MLLAHRLSLCIKCLINNSMLVFFNNLFLLAILGVSFLFCSSKSFAMEEDGINYLYPLDSWVVLETENSCQNVLMMKDGHQIKLSVDNENNQLLVEQRYATDHFDDEKSYNVDLYIDMGDPYTSTSVVKASNLLESPIEDILKFLGEINGAQELSIGFEESFYVIDLSKADFFYDAFINCSKMEQNTAENLDKELVEASVPDVTENIQVPEPASVKPNVEIAEVDAEKTDTDKNIEDNVETTAEEVNVQTNAELDPVKPKPKQRNGR